jgi:MFS transporter, DHA1 family, multidrug resistance protein
VRPLPSATSAEPGSNPSLRVVAVLALASAIAPFATDMYLPGLPRLARDFGVSSSIAQLTLTGFLLGLGLGQLIIGPLSDSVGRRRPLLIASAICIAASALCALAPSIGLLIAARFVQGFAGAAGAVIGRAVIADRTSGTTTARYFSLMLVITSVAPILAPITGAAVIGSIGWRGILWVITAITVVMFVGLATSISESLPPELRHAGGTSAFVIKARGVIGNRRFACYTATFAFGFMTMFGWISASPFVLQDKLGLSTTTYALAFASNAVALLGANAVNARIVHRYGQRRMIRVGLSSLMTASVLMGVNVALGTHLWPTLGLSFVTMGSMGLIMGNCASLAIEQVRHSAGTGSAVLGATQFGLGAVVAPIVGLAGSHSAAPLAISMIATTAIAVLAFVGAERG